MSYETSYDHLLPTEAAGFSLRVSPLGDGFQSVLYHLGEVVGVVTGLADGEPGVLGIHADLAEAYRGQGLGSAMYRALYAHAKARGFHTVEGGGHTEAAARVHRSLSPDYEPGYDSDMPHGGCRYPLREFGGGPVMRTFEFHLQPFRETGRKGWLESPAIVASGETLEEAHAAALAVLPAGHTIWTIAEITPSLREELRREARRDEREDQRGEQS